MGNKKDLDKYIIRKYNQVNKIMQDYQLNLIYPFHINHDLKQGKHFYNENYIEFHTHDFQSIIIRIVEEPHAFYLTDNDKKYYSKQELEIIEIIKNNYRKGI